MREAPTAEPGDNPPPDGVPVCQRRPGEAAHLERPDPNGYNKEIIQLSQALTISSWVALGRL